MKILYFANARIPTEKAHGFQIIKMCEAFSDAGVNLDLVLPTRKNKEFSGVDIFNYYDIRNNFKIVKLPTIDPRFLLNFPSGTYIKVQMTLFARSIKKFLKSKSLQGEILYTRDQYLLPTLFRFSDRVVWEVHDLPRRKAVYAEYWQKCYKIIVLTQSLKEELIKLGIDESRILISPDGVDLDQFSQDGLAKKELGLSPDKKTILYSGHLFDWKGAHVLAQAAGSFKDDVEIVFLGGTDIDIKNFKGRYQDKNIKILGRVPQKEVPNYLQSADVLVLPNSAQSKISSHYTSPLKLFEYMAAGKPIIASSLPSIKEILNSSNAVLVEPDNPQALAQGIKSTLEDDSLAQKISQQALIDVQAYSWNERSKNILDFIF